jgi:hypothetical protein
MGQRIKGGMWCATCSKSVMGVRNTQWLRGIRRGNRLTIRRRDGTTRTA